MDKNKVLFESICGKHFPINILKHEKDKTVFCPFCAEEIENPYYKPNLWTPDLNWIRKKIADYERKRKVTALLNLYFPKNISGERAFSYNSWRIGKRPNITRELIALTLNIKDDEKAISAEVERIREIYEDMN